MNGRDEETLITENDVQSSSIERRTFLGRFGLAAGLIGIAGMTQACGSGAASDSDQMEASDSDQMEASDSDQMEASDSDQMEASDSDSHQEETEESSDSDGHSDSGS
jgi:hypothetical protein